MELDYRREGCEKDGLFITCALRNRDIYAFTFFKRIPMIGNLDTGSIKLIPDLKNYDSSFVADHMINAGDDIFVLELNGQRLMKYNILEKKCQCYDIACGKKPWGNYAAFVQYGKYLYIFPRYTDGVIRVDANYGEVVKDRRLYTSKDCINRNDDSYFCCGCQTENIMWLFQRQSNVIIAYDMENSTWKKYEIDVEINNCIHALQYGNKLYILSYEGKLYSWDMSENHVEEIADCSNLEQSNYTFLRLAVTDKTIFLLPSGSEDILCINRYTKQVETYKDYPSDFCYCGPETWSRYYGYCEDDAYYYFAMRASNYVLSINKQTGDVKWIKFKLLSSEEYLKVYIKYSKSLLNEVGCSAKDVIYVAKEQFFDYLQKNSMPVGNLIWKQLQRS